MAEWKIRWTYSLPSSVHRHILSIRYTVVIETNEPAFPGVQSTYLRRNIYASAHFTKRFPGHAFYRDSAQDKDDEEEIL